MQASYAKQRSRNHEIRLRLGVILALLLFVFSQIQTAYASTLTTSAHMLTMNEMSADGLKGGLKDGLKKETQEPQVTNLALPPCHQKMMNSKTLSSKALGDQSSKDESRKTSKSCCDEHCRCIKSGANTMAFVPQLFETDFNLTTENAHSAVKENLSTIFIQAPYRPPIATRLG